MLTASNALLVLLSTTLPNTLLLLMRIWGLAGAGSSSRSTWAETRKGMIMERANDTGFMPGNLFRL